MGCDFTAGLWLISAIWHKYFIKSHWSLYCLYSALDFFYFLVISGVTANVIQFFPCMWITSWPHLKIIIVCFPSGRVILTKDMAPCLHWSRTHVLYSWYCKACWQDVKLHPNKAHCFVKNMQYVMRWFCHTGTGFSLSHWPSWNIAVLLHNHGYLQRSRAIQPCLVSC